ncbi:hypothetical protein HanIR_Chr04g0199491 [Helianthus annuus]|nr:hypothetical protein HanIR_Chr04g0199491 [Helianthus annuus]
MFESNQFALNKKRFNRDPNPNLKCTHYNRFGHTIERCFDVVGFPHDPKSTSRQHWSQNTKNSNPCQPNTCATNHGLPFNAKQISKLLNLINERKGCNIEDNSICVYNDYRHKVFSFTSGSNLLSKNGWVVDSGANQHMVMSNSNLFSVIDVSEFDIKVGHPNGISAKVTKIGSLRLSTDIILKDVFFVPGYYVNLLSVYKLTRDNKLRVSFDEHKCYLQDSHTMKTLLTGNQFDGLYFCGDASKPVKVCFNSYDQLNLWHSRLGHPSDQVLNVLKDDLRLNL